LAGFAGKFNRGERGRKRNKSVKPSRIGLSNLCRATLVSL